MARTGHKARRPMVAKADAVYFGLCMFVVVAVPVALHLALH